MFNQCPGLNISKKGKKVPLFFTLQSADFYIFSYVTVDAEVEICWSRSGGDFGSESVEALLAYGVDLDGQPDSVQCTEALKASYQVC